MLEEAIHYHLFRDKGWFLKQASFFTVLSDLWFERNNMIFRGIERLREEAWDLVWFHVSLWTAVSIVLFVITRLLKFHSSFCNYLLD